MTMISDTVAEFGRSMGMENLQLKSNGSVVLALQSIGTLTLEVAGPTKDAVLISLARPLAHPTNVNLSRLLAATHYRARLPVRLQLGVFRDELILAVILAPEELTLPKIHEVIQVLDRQHQALGDMR